MDRIGSSRRPLTTSVPNITFGPGASAAVSKSKASSVYLDQLPKGYFKKREDHQRHAQQERSEQRQRVTTTHHHNQYSANDGANEQVLSDSIVEKFTSHQPYDRNTAALAKRDVISRNRIVEEIDRIKGRRHINEEERATLLNQAMTMDAPKLARKIMEERKDYVEESKRGSSFLSCYNGDQDDSGKNDDDIYSNPSGSDASFYKAIAEVDHLRQRLLDRASIGTNSRIISVNASGDTNEYNGEDASFRANESKSNVESSQRENNLPSSSSSLSTTDNVTDLLNDLIGTDSTSGYEVNNSSKRVGSAKLRDARIHLDRAHDGNVYMSRFNSPSKGNVHRNSNSPSNESSPPNLKFSPYDIVDTLRDESFDCSEKNTSNHSSRERNSNSSSLLRASFGELHHQGRHQNRCTKSYQREERDIYDSVDVVNTSSISLQGVLADALALPSNQYDNSGGMDTTSKDLKVLLGVLEDQISSQRDHDVSTGVSNDDSDDNVHNIQRVGEVSPNGPSSKASGPRMSMMSPLIGEKYRLKREDTSSQLLSLATAIEAGDVAGRLLAAMMEKKSSTAKRRQLVDNAYNTGNATETEEERSFSSTFRK